MSKKKNKPQQIGALTTVATNNIESPSNLNKWGKWILLIFGFLLYANTLNHEYTQDDAIVIYDNMYTQKGIAGIPGLLSKDTFFGFFKEEGKAKLVSGGRYRPFTPIMFAIEYQFFGKKPMIGHIINAFLYGALGMVLFLLLQLIFSFRIDFNQGFKWTLFAACLLYLSHPIHTEAVANIKGRDEIMAMLGSCLATYFICKNAATSITYKNWILAFICYFIALMSKENAITFLAIIPLILYFFYNKKIEAIFKLTLPLLVGAGLFLIFRTMVLGLDTGGKFNELMNNPFLKLVNGQYIDFSLSEKLGTIFITLGKYISLLFFPHPLTHDYYPRHIEITTLSDITALSSMLVYVLMILAAIYYFKKDRIISFCLIFFIATLSIVSNIVFPVGTNMSERFLFMPSFGFCLLIPYLIYKLTNNGKTTMIITSIIILLFSFKTITRNEVWKNDFTLFTTDVKTSTNSAKILNAAGGALSTEAAKEKDEVKKKQMLEQALIYLDKAVKIHPTYKNAYLLLGNSNYYLSNYDKSIEAYETALKLDPGFKDAHNNLAVACRDIGKKIGQSNLPLAKSYLQKSYDLNPNDLETLLYLGLVYGSENQYDKAIALFEKVISIEPKNASAYWNLGISYQNLGDIAKATKYREQAIQLDPNIVKRK